VLLHFFEDLFANDNDDTGEPAGCRGADRIVHNGFAVRTHRGKLLQSTKTAAMASGEDDKLHALILRWWLLNSD
jgi:hypothetical protein